MQRIVESFLENMAHRNLDKLCDLFDEKTDWFIPGNENKANWLGKRNTIGD